MRHVVLHYSLFIFYRYFIPLSFIDKVINEIVVVFDLLELENKYLGICTHAARRSIVNHIYVGTRKLINVLVTPILYLTSKVYINRLAEWNFTQAFQKSFCFSL